MRLYRPLLAATAAITLISNAGAALAEPVSILNVSYDITREMYDKYNVWFSEHWEEQTGQLLEIRQSHAGSRSQASSVISGVPADVVSLSTAADINAIVNKTDFIQPGWESEFPHNSSPYTSIAVLLVREGNPKNIDGWEDLAKPDVSIITPNPKTSGSARWNFLAAWAWAVREFGSQEAAREYITKVYRNVPVLPSGGRGATTTFIRRGIGDVLITYENEALLALEKFGEDQFDLVVPGYTILIETPVAVVDANAAEHGTTEVSKAYLEGLYSDAGQTIIAKHFFRPADESLRKQFSELYAETQTFTIRERFGGWPKAQEKFFSDGAIFDQIYLTGGQG